jgi:peroxiredoxin
MKGWARAGGFETGDPAPDFTLSRLDRKGSVTLSSHRGERPVVLVFGSYT